MGINRFWFSDFDVGRHEVFAIDSARPELLAKRKPASCDGGIEFVNVSRRKMRRLVHDPQDGSRRSGAHIGICRNERAQPFERELLNAHVLIRRDGLQASREIIRHFKG